MSTALHSADAQHPVGAQLAVVLMGAAAAPLTDRALLRIAGPDATRWLNGMATNNIQSLQPGEGNYNFLLSAQGRILADCLLYRDPVAEPPEFLLETDKTQIATVQQHLDKFIVMDDVELAPLDLAGIGVIGRDAHRLISKILDSEHTLPAPQPQLGEMRRVVVHGRERILLYPPPAGYEHMGIGRCEIWCFDPDDLTQLKRNLPAIAANQLSSQTLEHLRILSGTPRYGTDIRNSETAHDLPQETSPLGVHSPALHFTKGCYLGQEIVERIRSRGNVHRSFSGFVLTGPLPVPGTLLEAESKPVGELTSVASIHLPEPGTQPESESESESESAPARTAPSPVQLALGYVRREALDRNLVLTYPGGVATPIALPYAAP